MLFSVCRNLRSIHHGPGHTDQRRTVVRATGGGWSCQNHSDMP